MTYDLYKREKGRYTCRGAQASAYLCGHRKISICLSKYDLMQMRFAHSIYGINGARKESCMKASFLFAYVPSQIQSMLRYLEHSVQVSFAVHVMPTKARTVQFSTEILTF